MATEKFIKKFNFGTCNSVEGYINITKDLMYSKELGYGFVTEKVKEKDELLQIPELGSAFDIDPNLAGQTITNILMQDRGGEDNLKNSFCYSDKKDIPLSFRVKVPHNGNYNVKLIMGDKKEATNVTVFSERRRCVLRNASAKAGEFIEYNFTANVCDIVPRGKKEVYHDDGLDITIIGDKARINAMVVEEAISAPTIYIAGDSTVTDQSAQYPYNPGKSYCGWAQVFPMFFKEGISVSNHAHSGLSNKSFKNEGHWAVVEKHIKPNDIFFIQFGHNDQKDKTLDAYGGYAEFIRWYIDEVRKKGAFPIVVTPVSRTIWNGPDGAFNDLLKDYAKACIQVAEEKQVPLVDLHGKSVEFVLKYGANDSTKFFYPKDWTHHNDFGAFEMAKLVVQAIRELNIKALLAYLRDIPEEEPSLEEISKWLDPVEDIQKAQSEWAKNNAWVKNFSVPKFVDIENSFAKTAIEELAKLGVIKAASEDKFLPDNSLTKYEFLDMLLRVLNYTPGNVFNDMYEDVLGHEWFAGIIQTAYDNEIIDPAITKNSSFRPEEPMNGEEMISMMVRSYKKKKNLSNIPSEEMRFADKKNISSWALEYFKEARALGIIEASNAELKAKVSVTRAEVATALKILVDKLA